MKTEDFTNLIVVENEKSMVILVDKAKEYRTGEDRLSNFKNCAGLRSTNPADALMGMLVKHFESVSQMCKCPTMYNLEKWDEKLVDIRNYTYLLKAVLIDIGVK